MESWRRCSRLRGTVEDWVTVGGWGPLEAECSQADEGTVGHYERHCGRLRDLQLAGRSGEGRLQWASARWLRTTDRKPLVQVSYISFRLVNHHLCKMWKP